MAYRLELADPDAFGRMRDRDAVEVRLRLFDDQNYLNFVIAAVTSQELDSVGLSDVDAQTLSAALLAEAAPFVAQALGDGRLPFSDPLRAFTVFVPGAQLAERASAPSDRSMVVEIAPVLAPPSSPAVLVAQRFEVRNFLSFDSEGESFNFQPLMVFVGPNGAGKTNLLKALDALSRLCRGWYVRPSDWQHRRPQSIATFGFFAISWTEGDRQFDYEVELGSNKGQDFIMRESLLDRSTGTTLIRSDERATLYRAIIRTSNGEERYADLEHATPRERTVVSLLGDQAPFQASANLRRLLTDYEIHARWRDRPMGLLVDGRSLRADGSNLPAVLAKLGRSGAQLQLLSKDLSDAAGEGSTLIPTSESAWHAIVAGVEFDSSSLSDGTQLWMHLMALLRNPDRTGPIAIDEPEVGLHPDLIDGFVRRVVELARTDAPVIMVTHSGQLLDSLQVNGEEDALRVVERVDDRTVISSPEPELVESWLKDMMLGEAWSAGAFGGNRW